MAKQVVMPRMGYDMDEGTLLRWLKQVGDPVERGEPIAEIETDKTNIEIESFESGVIKQLLIDEGQTVPVGEAIALVGAEGEEVSEADAGGGDTTAEAEAQPEAAEPAEDQQKPAAASSNGRVEEEAAPAQSQPTASGQQDAPTQVVDRKPGERVRASPLVRRLAAEHELDLSQIAGTGPGGRIIKQDVMHLIGQPKAQPADEEQAAAPEPAAAAAPASQTPAPEGVEAEMVDLSRLRKTIGKRMAESTTTAPHFFVTTSIDMAPSMALRKQINAEIEDGNNKVSVNDMIVKATALALRKFPMLNSSFAGDQIRQYKQINVNIAVAIEGGLISPFVPDADKLPLGQVAAISKDRIARARDGGLKPDEYQGGTFTISNLGMYDVDNFTAIINPPQAGILAIGSIKKSPVWNEEAEEFEPKDLMPVTISADHRVTDGVEAAEFIAEVKRLLEKPMLLLVS